MKRIPLLNDTPESLNRRRRNTIILGIIGTVTVLGLLAWLIIYKNQALAGEVADGLLGLLATDEPVPHPMLKEVTPYLDGDRLMGIRFSEGAIPSAVPQDRLVGAEADIMLFRKGAPDELVVSKSMIVSADGNNLGFHLDPTEREYLKEASAEPNGLYLVLYLGQDQSKAEVTYIPEYIRHGIDTDTATE